jgi:hypothetical protein
MEMIEKKRGASCSDRRGVTWLFYMAVNRVHQRWSITGLHLAIFSSINATILNSLVTSPFLERIQVESSNGRFPLLLGDGRPAVIGLDIERSTAASLHGKISTDKYWTVIYSFLILAKFWAASVQ